VVLAAGRGSRLGLPDAAPKPLAPLAGRKIIDYTLEAIAAAGIDDILVVVGYREDEVRRAIGEIGPEGVPISFVSNAKWDGPASTSLRAARDWCDEDPFLLAMSDHVLSPTFVQTFLDRAEPGECAVAADAAPREPAYVAEATLLEVGPDSRVTGIGKGRERWHALDAGAFILQPEAWEAVDAAPERCDLSTIFTGVASTVGLSAVDVTGTFWYDVDTPEDLATAERLLERRSEEQRAESHA
jgi:1L-myo-inositol 1-phosphate cytidylyltransferase/CDP-L-myo-inositol myo-inositolphosphotransferase